MFPRIPSRRAFVGGALASLALPALRVPTSAAANAGSAMPPPHEVAARVREEFSHAWSAYVTSAWGRDEVRPLSGTSVEFFLAAHPFGLSIVEALDTLYVMELDDQVARCVAWLRRNLDFDVDGEVEVFETIIRLVGGLLAGYAATGDAQLLAAARDLADRLLPAFTKSPSGAPYRFVNLKTGAVRDPKSNLAEIGTNIFEFGELSRLTNDAKYITASMNAYRAVIEKRSSLDLLATTFDVERGDFVDTVDVAPNPPSDSFFEYLWDAWQVFGNVVTRGWFDTLMSAMETYQVVEIDGRRWFRPVDYLTGDPRPAAHASELAAFFPAVLVKSGRRDLAAANFDAWTAVADRYELIPETIDLRDLSTVDASHALRPEYANAAFDLWLATGDERYRRAAYQYFTALRDHCRTPNGYAAIKDVRTSPMTQDDYFPAYAFAENFKYLYLMFADAARFEPKGYCLSTEGKILRGLKRP